MKNKAFILINALIFLCSCRGPRPVLIPEISPPLIQEEVFKYAGALAGDILFPCASGIGWVDRQGRVLTWDAEKKTAGVVIALPFQVSYPPFRQGDCLVLNDPAAGRTLLFDLAELKVKAELHDLQASRLLGVDRDCLAYHDGERLRVRFWKDPAGDFSVKAAEGEFFNCHFSPERILIFSRDRVFTFMKKSGGFQQIPLPVLSSSPFFFDGEHIYYGSSRRQLVKYSLPQKRLAWKMKLGRTLARQPIAFAGSIVANPDDNNVLQVNGRGSVRWWLALQSVMRFDLVPMEAHLAAFLLNREIRFIDLKRRQVTAFTSRGNPISRPLAVNQDLYFMLQDGKNCSLQRVGNHYGIELELDPAKVKWTGRSIRISIQSRNLLEPAFDLRISDREGQTVFSKSGGTSVLRQLVWIPVRAGEFTVKVTAKGLNREAEAAMSFQVLDPQKPVPGFYLHF